jgi:DNA replication protein DnaC
MKKFSDNNMSDEQLQELLRKLKLVFFAENLSSHVSAAAKNQVSCFNFLAVLAEGELAARSQRGIARRLQAAKIPVLYSMDSFDWSFPTRINRPQIEQLMRLEFMQNKGSVVIIGPVGVGKTRIASCLLRRACEKEMNALFVQAVDIVNDLLAAKMRHCFAERLKKYVSPALLAIDELGYLPLDKEGAEVLFQVFSKRYKQKSTIVTTNMKCREWAGVFNNSAMMASAVLDRLLENGEKVVIDGESYRIRNEQM